jgi:hypothetical protein
MRQRQRKLTSQLTGSSVACLRCVAFIFFVVVAAQCAGRTMPHLCARVLFFFLGDVSRRSICGAFWHMESVLFLSSVHAWHQIKTKFLLSSLVHVHPKAMVGSIIIYSLLAF